MISARQPRSVVRWFLAEFVAAQVRSLAGETVGDLWKGDAGIDYISVFLQPQVVISGFARPPFFRRLGIDEDVVVNHDAVFFETGCFEEFLNGLVSADISIVAPLEQPIGLIATVRIVIHRGVGGWRAGFHRVPLAAHEKVVPEVPVLPDGRWTKACSGATRCVVVSLDAGGVVIQLIAEAGDSVKFVADQIDGASVERLSGHAGVRVVASVTVESHVVATVIGFESIILSPGQIVVVKVNVHAVPGHVICRWAEVVDCGRVAEPCDAVVADHVTLAIHVDAGMARTHVGLARSRIPCRVDTDNLIVCNIPVL